ncbi:MAG: GNAT family N-acetyltransferase [Chloroflexota bacterium]
MPTHATIRIATPADAPALTQLAQLTYQVAFGASMSDEALQAHIDTTLSASAIMTFIKDDVVLVAIADSMLIGYCHISQAGANIKDTLPTADPDNSAYLQRLYVHPDQQNEGIGSTLLKAALKHPLLADAENVYLDVWEKNTGAQKLYARHGFQRVGEIRYVDASGNEGDLDYIMGRPKIAT